MPVDNPAVRALREGAIIALPPHDPGRARLSDARSRQRPPARADGRVAAAAGFRDVSERRGPTAAARHERLSDFFRTPRGRTGRPDGDPAPTARLSLLATTAELRGRPVAGISTLSPFVTTARAPRPAIARDFPSGALSHGSSVMCCSRARAWSAAGSPTSSASCSMSPSAVRPTRAVDCSPRVESTEDAVITKLSTHICRVTGARPCSATRQTRSSADRSTYHPARATRSWRSRAHQAGLRSCPSRPSGRPRRRSSTSR